jgi:hypothetical protein
MDDQFWTQFISGVVGTKTVSTKLILYKKLGKDLPEIIDLVKANGG